MTAKKESKKKRDKRTFKTEREVAAIKFVESGPTISYTDLGCKALKLLAQKRSKTWRITLMHEGRRIDEKVGTYPAISLAEARLKANEMQLAVERGEHRSKSEQPAGPQHTDLTLQDGFDLYLAERELRPATLKNYNSIWTHHFGKLKDRKMVELAKEPNLVKNWHTKLTKHSPGVARLAFALLQGVYTVAQDEHDGMPPAPLRKLQKPKTQTIYRDFSPDALRAHHAAVAACVSPTRANLADFLYLSGQRLKPVKELRWEWLREDRIIFPAGVMKGGEVFELPLTDELREVLARQRGKSGTFVFPGQSLQKPIAHLNLKADGMMNQQALRSHWSTVAHSMVPYIHAELLIDHTIPGVTGHYAGHRQVAFRDLAESMKQVTLELGIRKTTSGNINEIHNFS